MTVSASVRVGLPRWSAGTDPLTRAQIDGAFASIDNLMAIDLQDVLANRPAFGVRGRYFWASDTNALYRDTGTAWAGPLNSAPLSLSSTAATVQAVGDVATVGTATDAARGDHKHGLPGFGPTTATTTFGMAVANGTAVTVARADHSHGTPTAAYQAVRGGAAAAVTARPTLALSAADAGLTVDVTDDAVNAETDVRIGLTFAAAVVTEVAYGQGSAVGTAATVARGDHTHGTPPTPTAANVGAVARTGDTMTGALRIDKFVPFVAGGTKADRFLQAGERQALALLGTTAADQARGIELWNNIYYDGTTWRYVAADATYASTRFAAGGANGLRYTSWPKGGVADGTATEIQRFHVDPETGNTTIGGFLVVNPREPGGVIVDYQPGSERYGFMKFPSEHGGLAKTGGNEQWFQTVTAGTLRAPTAKRLDLIWRDSGIFEFRAGVESQRNSGTDKSWTGATVIATHSNGSGVGAGATARYAFHLSGVAACSIGIEHGFGERIRTYNNEGSGRADFEAGDIYSNGVKLEAGMKMLGVFRGNITGNVMDVMTFTAPASGRVVVEGGTVNGGAQVDISLNGGATYETIQYGFEQAQRVSMAYGLTPGASYTIRLNSPNFANSQHNVWVIG